MHLACSNNEIRPAMSCIYFKDGFAYASDGMILVKNRISECSTLDEAEIQALEGKLLHRDFYKDMIKYDDILISEEGIECHKNGEKCFFYFSTFGEGVKYPDAEKVLQEALNKPAVPLPQFAFNMENIQRLNKALYKCERCVATFKGTNQAIVFDSMDDDVSSIGLFMPCLSQD